MTNYPHFPELSRGWKLSQSESPLDPTIRDTQYENGMEATRVRWTRNRRTFAMSIDLITPADKDVLDSFYTDTAATGAAYGALPFLVDDPRNAENPQTYLVRFYTLPKYVDAGWVDGAYRYNVTFQVREV